MGFWPFLTLQRFLYSSGLHHLFQLCSADKTDLNSKSSGLMRVIQDWAFCCMVTYNHSFLIPLRDKSWSPLTECCCHEACADEIKAYKILSTQTTKELQWSLFNWESQPRCAPGTGRASPLRVLLSIKQIKYRKLKEKHCLFKRTGFVKLRFEGIYTSTHILIYLHVNILVLVTPMTLAFPYSIKLFSFLFLKKEKKLYLFVFFK